MSFWDLFKSSDRKRDRVAIEIDVAVGVLDQCPVCRGVSDKGRDDRLPAADLMAHQRFDKDDPAIAIFHGDRNDLLTRLRTVRRKFNFNCTCQDAG